MIKTQDDKEFLKFLNDDLNQLNEKFNNLTNYMANCNKNTKVDTKEFFNFSENLLESIKTLKFLEDQKIKLVKFINESKELIELVNKGNFNDVKNYVNSCSLLFKGPVGIRHVDFIAHKEE